MKVLFVTGTLTHGGAQRVISVVSNQLAAFGHQVSVIAFRKYPDQYDIDERIDLHYLAESEEEYEKISGIRRAIMLRKLIRKIKPEVAVGFLEGGYGMFISSIGLGFKKVASARVNPKYILEEGGSRGLLNNLWFRCADSVVMQTQSQIDLLPENCGWKNCTVIANPVSEAALECPEHNYNRAFRRIIMVGRLNEQKDYPTAIEAMKIVHNRIPDLQLDIYGQGDIKEDLENKIKEENLVGIVNIKGWTQDVVGELQESDLYVMSSLFEGMPNSLMEAMACGLVCISTDCETGPSDLIDDGKNGFLIPLKAPDVLASKIITIASMSDEQRATIGSEARRSMSESFSSQAIGHKWETILSNLIKEHK